MSEFIKVNHKEICLHNESVILNKNDVVLTQYARDGIEQFKYVNRRELSAETPLWYEITREEYDRLCKELGVDDA